tara:strand:+ start:2214 stop:3203 length:990 start_codon:yes stop_codon:yes gene_type:complete
MENRLSLKAEANKTLTPFLEANNSKAMQLVAVFKPMTEAFAALGAEFGEICEEYKKGYTPELGARAKTLRLKNRDIRTGTEKIKVNQKANLLLETKAIDGLNNIVKMATTSDEGVLKDIEDYPLRLAEEEKNKLQEARVSKISPYVENAELLKLSDMEEDVFEAYFLMKKTKFEEAEKEAQEMEEARILAEKKAAEEREAQRLENIKLKAEAEAAAKVLQAEKVEREKAEAKRAAAQKKKDEGSARILQAAAAALKAIKDEKAAAEKAKAKEAEALEKAGDNKKFLSIALDLEFIRNKFDSMKIKNKEEQKLILKAFDELIKHIENEAK